MPKPVPNTQTGSLTDHQRGTDDTLIGVDNALNTLYGDAFEMHDHARGGNDHLSGGAGSFIFLLGDAGTMDGDSRGGNDTLIGAHGSVNNLFGDAQAMHDNARGGNDTLIGLSAAPFNISTAPSNILYGDAFSMSDNARGGNDTLISGTGTDHMWGDAQVINGIAASPTAPTGTVITGADTFVFAPGSGNDDINDFRQSDHDKIDVSAYGFHSIADMVITTTGVDTKIAFDATNSVTLVGISDPNVLHTSDFILV